MVMSGTIRTDVSSSRGFIFMFTYEIHNAFMQKPEEYQAEEYQKMDESEVTPADYDDAVKTSYYYGDVGSLF